MKACSYCGRENEDTARQCVECGVSFPTQPSPTSPMSVEEELFWKRATFRDFGVIIIRLIGLCILFTAIIDLTYLPAFFSSFFGRVPWDMMPEEMKRSFNWTVIRIVLRVMAAFFAFTCAHRILGWLARSVYSENSSKRNGE